MCTCVYTCVSEHVCMCRWVGGIISVTGSIVRGSYQIKLYCFSNEEFQLVFHRMCSETRVIINSVTATPTNAVHKHQQLPQELE